MRTLSEIALAISTGADRVKHMNAATGSFFALVALWLGLNLATLWMRG